MQSKATTIEQYLRGLSDKDRTVIEALDQLVRTAAPDAIASMNYGMPTYQIEGRMLSLNAQKNYYSFYADPAIVKRYGTELGKLDVGKSCIRFRKIEDVSLSTLTKIVADYNRKIKA